MTCHVKVYPLPLPARVTNAIRCADEKGIKHVPASPTETGEPLAPTATPAPEEGAPQPPGEDRDSTTGNSPIKPGVAQQPAEESFREVGEPPPQGGMGQTTPDSPTSAGTTQQPVEERFPEDVAEGKPHDDAMEEGPRTQVSVEKSAVVEEESEEVAGDKEQEEETKIEEPKSRGDLLLELIQSYRGGMLRVDSNLRGAMFRSLRYLVSLHALQALNQGSARYRTPRDRCGNDFPVELRDQPLDFV